MKRLAIAVSAVVLALAGSVSAQTPAQPNEEVQRQYVLKPKMSPDQELLRLENEWADAVVKRDVAFLDRVLADDYAGTNPDGIVSTKAQSLGFLKSGENEISSLAADDMRVRVYGDTAVVTGRSTVKETFKGKDISGQFRWTDMWVKDYAGRWQCVASQSTRIAQE